MLAFPPILASPAVNGPFIKRVGNPGRVGRPVYCEGPRHCDVSVEEACGWTPADNASALGANSLYADTVGEVITLDARVPAAVTLNSDAHVF